MKYFLISLLIFVTVLSEAQPLPECVSTTKRLFIKSNDKILFHELNNTHSYIDSSRIECFKIWDTQLKDTLNTYFFEFEIYQANSKYQKKNERKMLFFVSGLKLADKNNNFYKDTFNLYIEISKFKEGIYYIDVSKKSIKTILVSCYMCRDSIVAINMTPNYYKKKKRKNHF